VKSFTRMLKDWLDPLSPTVQPATGLQCDQDFAPPEPGFWQASVGRGSDGRLYEMSPADHKRLRPIILRSERAIRNEEIAAKARAARRGGDHLPISIIPYGGREEFEPSPPEAEILPPVPRPVPDWVEWDDIVMPPRGAGDDDLGR
jgi:hypothetical protein